MNFSIKPCADSRRMPVGSPDASRSMAPPCGAFVFPVIPAAANAAELAIEMWPSMRSRKVGWPLVTLSKSWRVGSVLSAQRVWSQLPPVSQWPAGAFFAKASIFVSIAASDLTPVRSTLSLVWPALPRCVCASLKPGKTYVLVLAVFRSLRRVPGPARRVISSVVPMARTLPPLMAMASTVSGLSSSRPTPV